MYTLEEFDNEKTKVMKYIVYKRRTEHEVRTKFANSMDETILNDIIEYLKEAKYIDDEEYIARTINNIKNLKNLSIKEIKYKLLAKGINKDDIDNFFYKNKEKLEEYEAQSAKNIVIKKFQDYDVEGIKMYLLRKGYNLENISKAIEFIANN